MLTGVKTFPQMPLIINEKKVNYSNVAHVDGYRHNMSLDIGKSVGFALYNSFCYWNCIE